MEYLEGETLAARLTKGPLQTDQALRYAIEIADALDKAHRQGVVHRDLKPGNIMLTKSGAKLLDFGLAKLRDTQSGAGEAGVTGLPTQDGSLTGAGTIMGTFQYMAPEQLEGKEADARTDIFGFGAVVYEMATGRKAFEGESQASLIGAIMTSDPSPISTLAPMTPPALEHIVKRCLAKDLDERFDTAHDVMMELQWIAEGGSQVGVSEPVGVSRKSRRGVVWGLAALALGVVIGGIAIWNLRPQPTEEPRPLARFPIVLPQTEPLWTATQNPDVAISPDGTRIVYLARVAGGRQLYLRPLAELDFIPIRGTKGPVINNPIFSPNGSEIGFKDRGILKKVSIRGGSSTTISAIQGLTSGASWAEDGTIIFGTYYGAGLFRVPATGGEPQVLTTPDSDKGEQVHQWPEILPGGKAVLFSISTTQGRQLAVLDLLRQQPEALGIVGSNPHYSPTGHIVYGLDGALWAVPFDPGKLVVTGDPVLVLENVSTKASGAVNFSISDDGTLVYVPGGAQRGAERTLVWVDREGNEVPLVAEPRSYANPRISPDGKRVAVSIVDPGNTDVWIWDLRHNRLERLTRDPAVDWSPLWTPDGERLVFTSNREGSPDLYWKKVDGTGEVERLATSQNTQIPYSWSADGKQLIFYEEAAESWDIKSLSMEDPSSQLLLHEDFDEMRPAISPDGGWIAYTSNETGQYEIVVRPFPDVDGGRWTVSGSDESRSFVWALDGRELFYRTGDKMMAVSIQTKPTFNYGKAEVLFEGHYFAVLGRHYDIHSDGKRFLMIKEGPQTEETSAPTEIILVQNWSEELKRLVPTDN